MDTNNDSNLDKEIAQLKQLDYKLLSRNVNILLLAVVLLTILVVSLVFKFKKLDNEVHHKTNTIQVDK